MFQENKFKVEIISGLPQDATISLYRCGPMVRLCTSLQDPVQHAYTGLDLKPTRWSRVSCRGPAVLEGGLGCRACQGQPGGLQRGNSESKGGCQGICICVPCASHVSMALSLKTHCPITGGPLPWAAPAQHGLPGGDPVVYPPWPCVTGGPVPWAAPAQHRLPEGERGQRLQPRVLEGRRQQGAPAGSLRGQLCGLRCSWSGGLLQQYGASFHRDSPPEAGMACCEQ